MTQQSDVLSEPAPRVDDAWCKRVLAQTYGLEATVAVLRSERDHNVLVTEKSGRRFVLKISNSAEDPPVIDMENAAMQHVARVDPALAIPRLVLTSDGRTVTVETAPDGRTHLVRVVTLLPGTAADITDLPDGFASQLGDWSARLGAALDGFEHPAAHRRIEWDPRRVADLAGHVNSLPRERRDQVTGLVQRVSRNPERLVSLPAGVQHADLTMSNVLVDETAITGIIDFGDMHHTQRVADVAITLASLLRVVAMTDGDLWLEAGDFLAAHQHHSALGTDEWAVLGELVLARLTATVLISAWRAPANPDNVDYLTGLDEGSWRCLDVLGRLEVSELTDQLHRAGSRQ